MNYSKQFLISLYEMMQKIRKFEQAAEQLFLDGKIPGFIHLYIGEEAIAVGVMAALNDDDYITSTHRGHGHMIAKGGNINLMMAELYGKVTGYCRGKGGSMHIADFSIGVLGANGVVGGGLPIAVGAGLGIKMKGTKQVAVAFFGDGASNTGAFHESLNFASVFHLPVIFINENNQYASTAKTKETTSVENISDRAVSYNIPGVTINGNNILSVFETTKEAVKRARDQGGPTLIEAKTYRIKGHFVGDPSKYRNNSEVNKFWEKEPIKIFEKQLLDWKVLNQKQINIISLKFDQQIKEAIKFAEDSPEPYPKDALTDLFIDDSGYDY